MQNQTQHFGYAPQYPFGYYTQQQTGQHVYYMQPNGYTEYIVTGQMVPGQMIPGQMIPGQMIPGQMIPGQMIPGQMISHAETPFEPSNGKRRRRGHRGGRNNRSSQKHQDAHDTFDQKTDKNVKSNVSSQSKTDTEQHTEKEAKKESRQSIKKPSEKGSNRPPMKRAEKDSNRLTMKSSEKSPDKTPDKTSGKISEKNEAKQGVDESSADTKHVKTEVVHSQIGEPIGFTTVPNDGITQLADKTTITDAGLFIAFRSALIALSDSFDYKPPSVEELLDLVKFPKNSTQWTREKQGQMLQSLCETYDVRVFIYTVYCRTDEETGESIESEWINNYSAVFGKETVSQYRWFALADFGDHFELIVSRTSAVKAIECPPSLSHELTKHVYILNNRGNVRKDEKTNSIKSDIKCSTSEVLSQARSDVLLEVGTDVVDIDDLKSEKNKLEAYVGMTVIKKKNLEELCDHSIFDESEAEKRVSSMKQRHKQAMIRIYDLAIKDTRDRIDAIESYLKSGVVSSPVVLNEEREDGYEEEDEEDDEECDEDEEGNE